MMMTPFYFGEQFISSVLDLNGCNNKWCNHGYVVDDNQYKQF